MDLLEDLLLEVMEEVVVVLGPELAVLPAEPKLRPKRSGAELWTKLETEDIISTMDLLDLSEELLSKRKAELKKS